MSNQIHATAIIGKDVKLGKNVEIGPYCVIEGQVTLGDNIKLHSHVMISGITTIGEGTEIFPFASIGSRPQDLKFKGEKSELIIGKNNVIREHVTMNPGTEGGIMKTIIGDNCAFMVASHVAHDCIVGNNVILSNNATLAGHVEVGDFVIIGGLAAVHQFVKIGEHAMISGMAGVKNDVIPYGLVMAQHAHLSGLNLIGLERRGFNRKAINELRSAYRLMFAPEGTMAERLEDVAKQYKDHELVHHIIDFIQNKSERSICQPKIDIAA